MKSQKQFRLSLVVILIPYIAVGVARGQINGFGDFTEFSINQGDSASAPTWVPGEIHITGQAAGESRSVFYNTPQQFAEFLLSFTFRATGTPTSQFGACAVLQRSVPNGPNTVAAPSISGIGTKFGYSDFSGSFNHSVGFCLEYNSLGGGSSSTGQYSNGNVGGGSTSTSTVNLFSGHPMAVVLAYNGTSVHQTITDTVTSQSFEVFRNLNVGSFVGATTAYVGFTAATQSNQATDQYISDFLYSPVPEPSSLALLVVALAACARRARSLSRKAR